MPRGRQLLGTEKWRRMASKQGGIGQVLFVVWHFPALSKSCSVKLPDPDGVFAFDAAHRFNWIVQG